MYLTRRRGSNISSGTWMAAWRLTKAESCGVNWDDELPPVKPPASFQASHATPNTNKLKCWAHYSGTHNLTCSSDLTCICENASARDIHCMSPTRTSIALLPGRKSKSTSQPLSSPPACLACPTAPVSLLLTLDPIICRLRQQHAPLEGMRRLASLQQY